MKRHRLRVRELAEAKGLNITTFGRKAELAMGTARGYWYGTLKGFDADVLERVAAALDVSVSDLFESLPQPGQSGSPEDTK
jgi:transcriptional regulator with XRE-family HTH domain